MPTNRFSQAQPETFSDRELLAQLQRLVDAAASEADKWRNKRSWREPTEEECRITAVGVTKQSQNHFGK